MRTSCAVSTGLSRRKTPYPRLQTSSTAAQTVRVLCLGRNEKNPALLEGRTDGNKLVFFQGDDALVGNFATVRITEPKTYFMFGEIQ